jgi:hypothetical protein
MLEPRAADCGEISTSISAQEDLGLSVKFLLYLDDSNLLLSQQFSDRLFSGSEVLT